MLNKEPAGILTEQLSGGTRVPHVLDRMLAERAPWAE